MQIVGATHQTLAARSAGIAAHVMGRLQSEWHHAFASEVMHADAIHTMQNQLVQITTRSGASTALLCKSSDRFLFPAICTDKSATLFGVIKMLSIFRHLMKSEQGATAIEYTLIASLISVAAIVAMQTVGGKVSNVLTNVANAMK
jgi:pilus assembly protein Flp/PilA